MPDERLVLNAFMSGLIAEVGGGEAAAAVISARWGHPISPGTISKKKAGHLDWTVLDVIALQEAARKQSVTEWLVAMQDEYDGIGCLSTGAADLARESGEAVAAVLTARTPKDKARAIKELRDVTASSERLVDTLEARK